MSLSSHTMDLAVYPKCSFLAVYRQCTFVYAETSGFGWWRGVAVRQCVDSMKLLHAGPS